MRAIACNRPGGNSMHIRAAHIGGGKRYEQGRAYAQRYAVLLHLLLPSLLPMPMIAIRQSRRATHTLRQSMPETQPTPSANTPTGLRSENIYIYIYVYIYIYKQSAGLLLALCHHRMVREIQPIHMRCSKVEANATGKRRITSPTT